MPAQPFDRLGCFWQESLWLLLGCLIITLGCDRQNDGNAENSADPANDPVVQSILDGKELKSLPTFDAARVTAIADSAEFKECLKVDVPIEVDSPTKFTVNVTWTIDDIEFKIVISGIREPITESQTLSQLKQQYGMIPMFQSKKLDDFDDGALAYWAETVRQLTVWTRYQSFTLANRTSQGIVDQPTIVKLGKLILQKLE